MGEGEGEEGPAQDSGEGEQVVSGTLRFVYTGGSEWPAEPRTCRAQVLTQDLLVSSIVVIVLTFDGKAWVTSRVQGKNSQLRTGNRYPSSYKAIL